MVARPAQRARVVALATLLGIAGSIMVAPPASADVTAVTSTTTTGVGAGVSTPLSGMSVSVGDGEAVEVNVATTSGTLTVDTSSGVTLAYGYTATGAEVAFRGTGVEVNDALASIRLTASGADSGESATVSITARAADGYIYSSQTEHFYEYVGVGQISWTDARAAAQGRTYKGQQGYLATVPNAGVNDLITSKIPGALNVWLGGRGDLNTDGYGRVWTWVDGPLQGTVFTRCTSAVERAACDFVDSSAFYYAWAVGEPNNYTGGEPYVVTNWTTANGRWNDLPNNPTQISGYVVEYGDLSIGSTSMTGIFKASAVVAIHGVPGAPTSVVATQGVGEAIVSFDAPADDGGAAIDGYEIAVSPGGATVACASSPCTVTGLTGGQAYTFTVRAQNTYGWSAASAGAATTAGALPTAPIGVQPTFVVGVAPVSTVTSTGYPAPTFAVTGGALPLGVALEADGSLTGAPTVTGVWTVEITASNTHGSAVATFSGVTGSVPSVTSSSLGTLEWQSPMNLLLTASAVPGATWTITGGSLPAGLAMASDGRITGAPTTVGPYSVTVTATNEHGSSTRTFSASVVAIPASAPTLTDVSPGDGMLTLNFLAPTSQGGSSVTGYEYSLNGGITWIAGPLGVVSSPLEVTGLTNGSASVVKVRAVTVAGGGEASNSIMATPRTSASAPTIEEVASGNNSLRVTYAAPESNGGSPVIGYRHSVDGGVTWSSVMVRWTDAPFVIYGLTNGVEYTVVLRAVSLAGDGAPSLPVQGTPTAAPVTYATGGGDPELPELSPGESSAVVNGASASVTSEARNAGWVVTTPDAELAIHAYDTDAALMRLPEGSAFLEVTVGAYVRVQGQGFKPGTEADVWLFSTPVLLGTPTVLSDGTFSALLPIPAGTPAGEHTIQVNGLTVADDTLSAELGVRVAAAGASLASTGADVEFGPAVILVLTGIGLLWVTARRRRSAD